MRQEYNVKIVSKDMISPDTAYITIHCPAIANNAKPGQFVNVSCSKFLKRPFGIASVNPQDGTFCIGVKVVGKGTTEIAAFEDGKEVTVLGPLGNGFDFNLDGKYILVSGGTGVFPINFAHEFLTQNNVKHIVCQGFRDKSQILMNDPSFILTTDAGDAGIKGNCCDGLNTISDEDLKDSTVVCVGPLPMMKAVGNWATSKGLKCYISMEQRMACGIGICLVCICKVKAEAEGQEFNHVRCCKEGPVFPFEEVIW